MLQGSNDPVDDGGEVPVNEAEDDGGFQGGDGGGISGTVCNAGPDEDKDADGFSINQGDCNDCDANVNPGAIEVPTDATDPEANVADENCNGEEDEVMGVCDDALDIADVDPLNGARAIGLCDVTSETDNTWGVIDAAYVRANGTPVPAPALAVGLLDSFGPNVTPRQGTRLLSMSSGTARVPGQPGACNAISCDTTGLGVAPAGYPQDAGCGGDTEINDDIGLEVRLRAPSNSTGYSYEFSFYSHEYPEWVCTSFNDQYIALVDPAPMGSLDGNISFDSNSKPVSVNIALFNVCSGCSLGTDDMIGTGFDTWGSGIDDSGATGWLQTTAPVDGGEVFTIRFALWDTGDSAWDSTVIIDNFEWIADAGSVTVGTVPVPK